MTPSEVIVVAEGDEPALSAGSAAHPRLMESVDPHGERLEPLFNQISLDRVEVTAGIISCERGRIVHPVDEKRRFREVVFLGRLTEKLGS
jgi:hypothetical protein